MTKTTLPSLRWLPYHSVILSIPPPLPLLSAFRHMHEYVYHLHACRLRLLPPPPWRQKPLSKARQFDARDACLSRSGSARMRSMNAQSVPLRQLETMLRGRSGAARRPTSFRQVPSEGGHPAVMSMSIRTLAWPCQRCDSSAAYSPPAARRRSERKGVQAPDCQASITEVSKTAPVPGRQDHGLTADSSPDPSSKAPEPASSPAPPAHNSPSPPAA